LAVVGLYGGLLGVFLLLLFEAARSLLPRIDRSIEERCKALSAQAERELGPSVTATQSVIAAGVYSCKIHHTRTVGRLDILYIKGILTFIILVLSVQLLMSMLEWLTDYLSLLDLVMGVSILLLCFRLPFAVWTAYSRQ